jgi:hypothetical protein
MKRKRLFNVGFTLAVAVSLAWNAAAQTQVRTLNLSDRSFTYNPGNPANCQGGNFWTATYDGDTTSFKVGSFIFSHNSGWNVYSYWGGFTVSKNADSLCYTTKCLSNLSPCAQSGSNGWIYNQWGVRAGGGIAAISGTTVMAVSDTIPYLIGYWDYFSDGIDPTSRSLQVKLDGDSLFTPNEIYICNHPWPYYGNIWGDGFARPLDSIGDYFKLWIHAIHSNNTHDSISVSLARNVNGTLRQSSTWQRVDLSGLNTNVKLLYFSMESTDELVIGDTNYGPNTAVYFCLDKLKVTKTGGIATNTNNAALQKAKATNTIKAVEVTDYFPVKSYSGGNVIVYDFYGKEVLRTIVKADEKINLSKLSAGEYRLQHGNKLIPVIKKGSKK